RIASEPPQLRESIERDKVIFPEIWKANERRDSEEPLRLKLSFIRARIEATRREVAARDGGSHDAVKGAYKGPGELISDLELVRDVVLAARGTRIARNYIEPFLDEVRGLGLHGFNLDVREDSAVHTQALRSITQALGIPELDSEGIRRELLGRRPLTSPNRPLDDETEKVLAVFEAMRTIHGEIGHEAADTYIISMCHGADDMLRVALLARERGLLDLAGDVPHSSIDIVPLFETRDDLAASAHVLRELLADEVYRRQLRARGMRQEIMLG